MAIELDIPDIKVLVRTDPNYNVVIHNPRSSVYRSGSYISIADLALTANTASFAVTASYAQTINRQISGSVGITGSLNITDNLTVEGIISAEKLLVSSSVIYESGSTKFGDSAEDTHQFTGSVLVQGPVEATSGFTGSFKGDGSQLTGLVTDLRISGSTGSDILNLLTDDLIFSASKGIEVAVTDNKVTIEVPVGLSASLYGTASVAEGIHIVSAGIYLTGSDGIIIPAPSGGYTYISTASYALTASYIANNTWGNLLNIPTGLLSSSVQVYPLPVESASYALTASYAMNGGGGGSTFNISQLPDDTLVGDNISSSVGGTPIEIDYGITKGDFANRFTGVKIYNYDYSGGNLAGQVEFWTDSEAQDYSTRRFYIDGFGKSVFTSNVEVTGSLTTTGNVIAQNYVQTSLLYNGGPIEIRSYYLPLQINSNGAGIILNDNVQVTGSLTVSGSSTFYGDQTISGSSVSVLDLHGINDGLWWFRLFNDSYNLSQSVFAGWVENTGTSYIGNEVDTPINIYTNAQYGTPNLQISSSGLTIQPRLTVIGNQVITGSLTVSGSSTFTNIGPAVFSGSINATSGITGSLFGTSSWADTAVTASYVVTASYALNGAQSIPTGTISSSAQVIAALPVGTVSSSLQINTGSFSGSITTASYALTASYVSGAASTWNSISGIPNGLISSSTQVITSLPAGTVSSSAQLPSGTISSSTQLPSGLISSSTQLPSGIVSSSTQVTTLLPAGTVSSSTQINTGSFTGSFIGTHSGSTFGTASWAQNAVSSSFATTASAATSITFTPTTASFANNAATASVLLGFIESASFATTASYALAATAEVPQGTVSSSQQIINYNVFATTGSNTFVGNQVFSGSLTTTEVFIGSLSGTSSFALNAGTASYVEYANVANKPTLVSSSTQISYTSISNVPNNIISSSTQLPTGIISSSTQLPTGIVSSSVQLPTGIVSSSVQVQNYNIFATTGSNTFTANQVISGSLIITSDLTVQGSSSIVHISQSTLNIETNLVTVNTKNPTTRFGGLAVIDSGSSPQVSGSLLFDSVENQWVYVHQGAATTSSILLMGPETYNNLGNETHPTTNRVMKSINDEHIGDSQITDDGTTVSIPNNLTVATRISGSQFTSSINNAVGYFGTASWAASASRATTSSFATTASFVSTAPATASFAVTSSYIQPLGLPPGVVSSSAQIASFGNIRLQMGTNRSNASAFYFNSNTRTAADSASPTADTAFLIQSTGLTTVTVYLRQDNAGPNNTVVGVAKNANGSAFSTATLITSSSLALAGDTIQTYTFSGLTLNQFDSIHIYCDPTSTPGTLFAVVLVS